MQIDIQVQEKRFYLQSLKIKAFCQGVIASAWAGRPDAEISVVLANDDFVHALNKQYRGQDKPTNVLSFENEGIQAGDIVVAYGVLKREAKEMGKPFLTHLAHLLVHGTLHLQGYDHITDKQAQKMEKLEIQLLKEMGYPNPYREV
ncbi:MAG: rRNA maturation RNase YbeY [Alphaproteobacteria bacterium]|nr:rRNA maturation RNase YbeY [Alphaproteobacteria bacterium]